MPGFNPVPSLDLARLAAVSAATTVPASATAVAVPVIGGGTVPDQADADAAQLDAAGFDGAVGSSVVLPSTDGTLRVAVGVGDPDDVSAETIRDAAGAFGRATRYDKLAVHLPATGVDPARGAQAVVEGVLLSRYTYDALRSARKAAPVAELTLVTDDAHVADVQAGAERGRLLAAATMAARDLANTPHNYLSASDIADLAVALGPERGLTVEVFGKDELLEMGCGGMLGVNAGSAEPPRLVKLRYTPDGEPAGHLTLVGKGIMYDSGGLALKPGDEVHAQMKNDMSGAAAVLKARSPSGPGCGERPVTRTSRGPRRPPGASSRCADDHGAARTRTGRAAGDRGARRRR